MSLRIASLVAGVLTIAPSAFTGLAAQTAPSTRAVYVTALDGKGVPVAGLTAADFTIKEDGKVQQVISAEVATTPLTVALMIDDSGLGLQSIREGAAAFVTRLRGLGQIALFTTGGRNLKLVDYTDSTAALMGGINRTFARQTSGAFLVDGLADAAKEFTAREIKRPVIVSVATEGEEFSQIRTADAMAALQRSGAQVYLVRLGRPVVGSSNAVGLNRGESNADEMAQANAVFGQAPPRTGGRIEQLASHTGIPRLMAQIATELAGQYVVTYTTPHLTKPDVKLEVSTSQRGTKVRAPQRVGPVKN
jgi:VWFA-related protein